MQWTWVTVQVVMVAKTLKVCVSEHIFQTLKG